MSSVVGTSTRDLNSSALPEEVEEEVELSSPRPHPASIPENMKIEMPAATPLRVQDRPAFIGSAFLVVGRSAAG
jgi:hypothetical protein